MRWKTPQKAWKPASRSGLRSLWLIFQERDNEGSATGSEHSFAESHVLPVINVHRVRITKVWNKGNAECQCCDGEQ